MMVKPSLHDDIFHPIYGFGTVVSYRDITVTCVFDNHVNRGYIPVCLYCIESIDTVGAPQSYEDFYNL